MAWGQRRRDQRQPAAPPSPRLVAARHGCAVVSAPAWLRQVEAHPDTADLRADSLTTLRAVAWSLAVRARGDATSAPTWAALMERTGRSRATVARWLAWLRERGLLVVVETGSTQGDSGPRCAVYALTRRVPRTLVAPVDEDETPPCAPSGSTQDAGARGATSAAAAPPGWSRTRPATTRQERLALVERLRSTVPALRAASPRALRSVLRSQLQDGWTVADLVAALDRVPDGTRWTYEAPPRDPVAWLRWRLRPWQGHEPPSSTQAAQHAARLAAQAAHREAAARDTAAAAPCPAPVRAALRQAVAQARHAARAG